MSVFTRIRTDDGNSGHSSWTSCPGAKRCQKTRKIVNLELTNNSRRKPMAIGTYCRFNDQLYGRTVLVRPYSCRRIVAIEAAASNSSVPCNWIEETTYRTPRNRRNLTSGRDLEGELARRGSIFNLRRLWRPRHQSPSSTAASPPSSSIPSTSP